MQELTPSKTTLYYGYIMGTRELRIIRFRDRYFIYYNNYDSYLKSLGRELVSNIPTDTEQYKSTLNTHPTSK